MYAHTRETITSALQLLTGEEDIRLEDGGNHADFTSTVAFVMSKRWGVTPECAAKIIADTLNGA